MTSWLLSYHFLTVLPKKNLVSHINLPHTQNDKREELKGSKNKDLEHWKLYHFYMFEFNISKNWKGKTLYPISYGSYE